MSDKPLYILWPVMGDMKCSTERATDAFVTKVTWPVKRFELVRVMPRPAENRPDKP